VRRFVVFAAVLVLVALGTELSLSSSTPVRSGLHLAVQNASSMITLSCADSAGQQRRGGERVIGGVEGLVLPGSGDPAALYPISGPHGKRYFVYKAFLAVASSAAPYATVSIVSPASATLYYGSSGGVDKLTGRALDRAMMAASRSRVRLPVCGANYTGYVGGIIDAGPTWVIFSVSSPHEVTKRVRVSIGAN
jgi:hypothetical protein